MRHLPTRQLGAALAVGSALLGAVAAGPTAAPASAAPAANGTARSDTSLGLVYTGGAGANRVTVVTAPGDRFLVSDTAPITAGPGCVPATAGGGLFAVSCVAPGTRTASSGPSGSAPAAVTTWSTTPAPRA